MFAGVPKDYPVGGEEVGGGGGECGAAHHLDSVDLRILRARHDRVQQLRGGWGRGVVDDQKVGHSLSVVAGRGARKSSRVLSRASLRSPCRAARSGLKIGAGRPQTPSLLDPHEVVG